MALSESSLVSAAADGKCFRHLLLPGIFAATAVAAPVHNRDSIEPSTPATGHSSIETTITPCMVGNPLCYCYRENCIYLSPQNNPYPNSEHPPLYEAAIPRVDTHYPGRLGPPLAYNLNAFSTAAVHSSIVSSFVTSSRFNNKVPVFAWLGVFNWQYYQH